MTYYVRNDSILAADMNNETVMMNSTTGKYYNIGEIGGNIWELLENELTIDEIVEKLTSEYDVDKETCKQDIMPFIEQMIKEGLIEKSKN